MKQRYLKLQESLQHGQSNDNISRANVSSNKASTIDTPMLRRSDQHEESLERVEAAESTKNSGSKYLAPVVLSQRLQKFSSMAISRRNSQQSQNDSAYSKPSM